MPVRAPFRRCGDCGDKTHHMFWVEGVECPSCGSTTGFSESWHGGLTLEQLRVRIVEEGPRRGLTQKQIKERLENLGLNTIRSRGKERF